MNMRLTIIVATLSLAACQGSSTVRDTAGANRFIQLEGASVVLKQTLDVPSGKARVFLQDGRVSSGFDSYRPHCAFEIKSVQHDGVAIAPDTFVITRVQDSLQQVVSAEPVRVAALRLAAGVGIDGGSSSYYQGYHFWLSSVAQPDVRRMSCLGVFAQPYELYPPTVEEIAQALGGIAEIRR